MEYKTFRIETLGCSGDHNIGDVDCPECFGGNGASKCKCGGLIHTQYVDSTYSQGEGEDVILTYECDKCGRNYERE